MEINLDYLSFTKTRTRIKGLIGYVNFKIGNDYSYYQLPTYLLKNPKGNILIRLLYPDRQPPPSREMQEAIDLELSAYLSCNYGEIFNVSTT